MKLNKNGLFVLSASLLLISQTAHADFRKALDAYQARDGAAMLKEVKEAVETGNDDGLMLFLSALQLDEITSDEEFYVPKAEKRSIKKKTLSTFETILNVSQQQEIRLSLASATKNSSPLAQYRLMNMPKFDVELRPVWLKMIADLDAAENATLYLETLRTKQVKYQKLRYKRLESIANLGYAPAALTLHVLSQDSPNLSPEKSLFWLKKSAQLGNARAASLLATKYLETGSCKQTHHQKNLTLCLGFNEEKAMYWLQQAAMQIHPAQPWINEIAEPMADLLRKRLNGQPANLLEAYRWYLVGVNSPFGGYSNTEKLAEMKRNGELKQINPELDRVWDDVTKRNAIIYSPNQHETPQLLFKNYNESPSKPLFSYTAYAEYLPKVSFGQYFGSYHIALYADGKVKVDFKIPEDAGDEPPDVYMQVSPNETSALLDKLQKETLKYLLESNEKPNFGCLSDYHCFTNVFHSVQVFEKSQLSSISVQTRDFQNTKWHQLAQVITVLEDYFPTQKLRCEIGASDSYKQTCIKYYQQVSQASK